MSKEINISPTPISSPETNPLPQRRQDLARLIDYYRLVVETFVTERIKKIMIYSRV